MDMKVHLDALLSWLRSTVLSPNHIVVEASSTDQGANSTLAWASIVERLFGRGIGAGVQPRSGPSNSGSVLIP